MCVRVEYTSSTTVVTVVLLGTGSTVLLEKYDCLCIRCIFKVNGAALLYLVVVLVSPLLFSCPLIFMTMAALESYNEPYLSFVKRFSTDMDKISIYYN